MLPSLRWLNAAAFVLTLFSASAIQAQPYVNVTVGGAIAPGVYGQIGVGSNPAPPLVRPRPVHVGPAVHGVPPMYVYAPPNHMQHWGRYCAYYRACGSPVYFVDMGHRDRWWDRHDARPYGHDRYRHGQDRPGNSGHRGHDKHRDRDRDEDR